MTADSEITQAEVDDLATKIDYFAEGLNDDQRQVLLVMFRFAGQALEQAAQRATSEAVLESHLVAAPSAGRLSDAFLESFARGEGSTFETVVEPTDKNQVDLQAEPADPPEI